MLSEFLWRRRKDGGGEIIKRSLADMKERPIIFGTWAIPKLLDGSKTQTRRTRGLEEINKHPSEWVQPCQLTVDPQLWTWRNIRTGEVITIKCPYGKPGDKLWVRETWALYCGDLPQSILYKADSNILAQGNRWHSAIHMFRRDSRIDLKITEIRGERVQEITEEDAMAEGIFIMLSDDPGWDMIWQLDFRKLWDSLNAKRYPWSLNPWEWPITFELVI